MVTLQAAWQKLSRAQIATSRDEIRVPDKAIALLRRSNLCVVFRLKMIERVGNV